MARNLTWEQLAQHFMMPLEDAARVLGVGSTSLKRACRAHRISRWPYRRLVSLDKRISSLHYSLEHVKDPAEVARLHCEIQYAESQKKSILQKPTLEMDIRRRDSNGMNKHHHGEPVKPEMDGAYGAMRAPKYARAARATPYIQSPTTMAWAQPRSIQEGAMGGVLYYQSSSPGGGTILHPVHAVPFMHNGVSETRLQIDDTQAVAYQPSQYVQSMAPMRAQRTDTSPVQAKQGWIFSGPGVNGSNDTPSSHSRPANRPAAPSRSSLSALSAYTESQSQSQSPLQSFTDEQRQSECAMASLVGLATALPRPPRTEDYQSSDGAPSVHLPNLIFEHRSPQPKLSVLEPM